MILQHVRHAAVLALSTAAHNRPNLIKGLLPELLPLLYDRTIVKVISIFWCSSSIFQAHEIGVKCMYYCWVVNWVALLFCVVVVIELVMSDCHFGKRKRKRTRKQKETH